MLAIARAYAPEAADDLFQELALQLWKSLARFEGQCELTTWAYRVHLNTAMSWRRSAARRRQRFPKIETLTDQVVDPNHHAFDVDERLRRLIASIGETDRAVLLMFLDKCDNHQIADVMGVSEGAIRVRLHRISKRIEEGDA